MTGADETQVDTFAAACVQFDVVRGDLRANLAAATAGLEAAAAAGARLCVLPEMWPTSFLTEFPPALVAGSREAEAAVQRLAATHGLVVVGSAVEVDGDRVFNTARVFDRGVELGTYRKIHLFSPNGEHRTHDAGDIPLVLDTSVGRMGVMICYDLRFPELARYYFHKGAEFLVVPAQWPEARAQHWRTLLRARAIENEMFVVGSNRLGAEPSLKTEEELVFPGDGRIIDPTGEILAQGAGDDAPVVAEIELRKVRTMRRILPVGRDQRPPVYWRLLNEAWQDMMDQSRDGEGADDA